MNYTRRQINERRNKRARQKRAAISGRQPARSPEYLAWIRKLPCCVCGGKRYNLLTCRFEIWQSTRTEAAHVGERGLRQKCSDRETIPLCAEHHRTGKDSHHVAGKRFWEIHGLNRDELVAALQAGYEESRTASL